MSENEQSYDLNYAVYLRIQEIMEMLEIKSISQLAKMSGVNKSTISMLKTKKEETKTEDTKMEEIKAEETKTEKAKKEKTVTLHTIRLICDSVGISLAEFFDSPLFPSDKKKLLIEG